MKAAMVAIAVYASSTSLALAEAVLLTAGRSFVQTRAKLYADGWRADTQAHVASGEYMGLDRLLVQSGFIEVDYCSTNSFCVLQYTRGGACLRLHTQGEQIRSMKITGWSDDCRDRGKNDEASVLPGDARYLVQWRNDCEKFGQCKGIDRFLLKLKKKYADDPVMMQTLDSYAYPFEAHPKDTIHK